MRTVGRRKEARDSEDVIDEGRWACGRCGRWDTGATDPDAGVCAGCFLDLALDESPPAAFSFKAQTAYEPARGGVLGQYELIEEVGRGGMGVIYKARPMGGGDVVAIKVLQTGLERELEAPKRLGREAQAMASLSHPFIMPIFEVCLEGPVPYFVMEFAPAGSLAELIPKFRGRWRRSAELVVRVARAIDYAHRSGLIHRDLKPGNILFTQNFEPLVSDFGLAKQWDVAADDLTKSLVIFGTPNYISPEQASGSPHGLTPATDIFALGAIFFELLAGRPPYVGDNALQVLRQAQAGPPPRLRTLVPGLPADLEAICARCLETVPERRYPSAEATADDIERWLTGERVVARVGLMRRLGTKQRWSAVAAVGVSIALAGAAYPTLRTWASAKEMSRPAAGVGDVTLQIDDLSAADDLVGFSNTLSRAFTTQSDQALHIRTLPANRLIDESDDVPPRGESLANRSSKSPISLRESIRRVGSQVRIVSKVIDNGVTDARFVRVDMLPLLATEQDFRVLQQTLREKLQVESIGPTSNPQSNDPRETEAAVLCTKAREYYTRVTPADNDRAIALYQNALKLRPASVQALAGVADGFRMKFSWWGGSSQDLGLALQSAEKAVATDPFSAAAHHAMGGCAIAAKQYEVALEQMLREMELNPESAGGSVNAGICCRELGRPRQGLLWYRRAARLDPIHGSFMASLGDLYMVLGDDLRAEKELRRACELDPEKFDAHNSLVVLALWQGRYDAARQMCRDVLARFPINPYGEQMAAEVAFVSGNSEEALDRYSKLATTNTYEERLEFFGSINPFSAVALLLQRQGHFEAAARNLRAARASDEQLLKRFPNNPMLLHDLAAVSALEGCPEASLESLAAAIHAGWVERRSTLIDPRFASVRGNPHFAELLTGPVVDR